MSDYLECGHPAACWYAETVVVGDPGPGGFCRWCSELQAERAKVDRLRAALAAAPKAIEPASMLSAMEVMANPFVPRGQVWMNSADWSAAMKSFLEGE